MKIGLKCKFIVPTIGFIILGMGIATVIDHYRTADALKKAFTGQLTQTADVTAKFIDLWAGDRQMDVRRWAAQNIFRHALRQDSAVGRASLTRIQELLKELQRDSLWFESIILADARGTIIASSMTGIVRQINISDRVYFKETLGGKAIVSDIILSRATESPVFTMTAPIRDEGKVTGVLFSVIDLEYFNSFFVTPVRVGKHGFACMFKENGQLLAFPDKSKILKSRITDLAFGKALAGKKEGLAECDESGVRTISAFRKVETLNWTFVVTADTDEILAPARDIRLSNGVIVTVMIILVSGFIFLLTNSVINPIQYIITGLNEEVSQIAAASEQVTSSGLMLAEGSSRQAASLEETSGSLEEMAAMIRANADNAAHAQSLMKSAKGTVDEVKHSMHELRNSMDDILKASGESSEIIKTIDEIAFQTNMLALNAAVEAARAGEAGAGFAVVAAEVRNLALRSAKAARNTSVIIENTVRRIGDGSELVESTRNAFLKVAENSVKVNELISGISAASGEQAQGTELINRALTEIDKVSQQDAASAEEYASLAEEMNDQTKRMGRFIRRLASLVEGASVRGRYRKKQPVPVLPQKHLSLGDTRLSEGTGQEEKPSEKRFVSQSVA